MTQTMSHPNDWAQFYHQISFSGQAPEAPATVPPPDDTPTPLPGPTDNSTTHHDVVQGGGSSVGAINAAAGRVAKPKRRRSRASRRTPTTLLSTDTANFRAMVQQFTGGPGAHFLAAVGARPNSINTAALNINFGMMDPAGRGHGHQLVPPGVVHHSQVLQQQHAGQQRPAAFSHAQDQVHAYMLSLDPAASSDQFPPPRPPFMQ